MEKEIQEKLSQLEELIKQNNLQQKEYLNLEEAATYLGISKSTLYKFTSGKKIRYTCPQGKRIFFSRKDLNEFLMQNPHECQSIIDSRADRYTLNNPKNL